MKKLILLGLIATAQLNAQDLEWFNAEHRQGAENFRKMTFIASDNAPYFVLQLEQLIPQGGGGGAGPDVTQYLYAYDTAGNKLWDFQIPSSPVKILDAGDQNFWLIMSGPQSLNINGTVITSDFPWPEYRNYYFIKCNSNGEVIDHFYWENTLDILWFIEDIAMDWNGDFIFVGRMNPDQLSDLEIEFANTSIALPGDKSILYLARASNTGEQIAIETMETNRFGSGAIVRFLQQNNQNGDIMVAGRMNDNLIIGNETLSHDHPHRDLLLLRFSAELEYQEGDVFPGSTYGSLGSSFKFNPVNQRFYMTGTLGDELFLLDPDQPVAGHFGAASNHYIAEFDGINLIQGKYLIPLGSGNFDNVNVQDIAFDEDGDLRLVLNVHDFSFMYGDSLILMPSDLPSYDLAVLTLRHESLSIQNLSRTTSAGQTYARATYYNAEESALYAAGTFRNTFTYGDYSEKSFAGQNDGFILKLTDEESTITSVSDIVNPSDILLFPNPARTHFSINDETDIQSVSIQNLNGQLVRQYETTGSQTFSTADITPGLYLVSIRTTEKNITKKLIIQ